jgi:hypothetical protein
VLIMSVRIHAVAANQEQTFCLDDRQRVTEAVVLHNGRVAHTTIFLEDRGRKAQL